MPFPDNDLIDAVKAVSIEGNGANDPVEPNSVQWRSEGEPASVGYELQGHPLRIFSSAEELPPWWSPSRDVFLRKQLAGSSFIGGIVYGETTRVKNTPWVLIDESGGDKGEIEPWQKLLSESNFGQGFRSLLHSMALDLLTQDNGSFVEIVGPGEEQVVTKKLAQGREFKFTAKGPRTGKPEALAYLDAGQCWRTYDPEYPVIYTNPYTGRYSILHWTRVIMLSQFEQGYELGRKIGLCALSRVYEMARLVNAMHTYQYEKLTGQAPEIFFTNVPTTKLEEALTMANISNMNKGFGVFKDSAIVSPKSGGVGTKDFKIDKLGLREIGDSFDYEGQLTQAIYISALAFGIDAREIWPATTSGATKADAEIQHMKTTGKGRADIMQMIEDAINWRVFPPNITFKFDLIDDLEDKQKADIASARASTRATQIASGEISIEEAREMAAAAGDINPSFLGRQIVADDTTDATVVRERGSTAPARTVRPDDNPDADTVAPDKDQKKKITVRLKQYERPRTQFFILILRLTEAAAAGEMRRGSFTRAMNEALRDWLTVAFVGGMQESSENENIEPDKDEQRKLDHIIAEQQSYVAGLASYLYDGVGDLTFASLYHRVSMWVHKGFDFARNTGFALGKNNQMMEWRLGRTEKHCPTCLSADGQVHRAKEWERAGILPRSSSLACRGFFCDCELVPTTSKAVGRLSRIPLGKKAHSHAPVRIKIR